jgi:hypothetical protein
MEIEDKWAIVFKNKNLRLIRRLVSALLSIPASNAFYESVFSLVNNVWTEEKNRFLAETVNAIVSVKLNADFFVPKFLIYFCPTIVF